VRAKVLDANEKLINGFQPSFGNTWSEFFVDEESGEVTLLEAAIRGGGACLSSDIVPLTTGTDAIRALIHQAVGWVEPNKPDNTCSVSTAAGYMFFHLPEGFICSVKYLDDILAMSGVHKAYLDDVRAGCHTHPMTDKSNRIGPIVVSGANRLACQETMNRIRHTLAIEVRTDDGIRGIIWD